MNDARYGVGDVLNCLLTFSGRKPFLPSDLRTVVPILQHICETERSKTIQECADLPLTCEADHESENGSAAHLRKQINLLAKTEKANG
jgi:hypothetical protein